MRKMYSLMASAVAVFAVLSCAKDIESDAGVNGEVVEFSASITSVKAGLNAGKTEWKAGDKISVNGVEFTAETSGATSTFKGTVPPGTQFEPPFKAVYPVSAGKDLAKLTVPAEQKAVEGSFDPEACVVVAESSTKTLAFKNVTSLVKFTVADRAKSVTLTSNNNSAPLCGEISANGADGSFTGTPSGYAVTVNCPEGFKVGAEYYMAVLPGTHDKGFAMSVDGFEVKSATKALPIAKSTIVNAGKLPGVLKFVPKHWVSDNAWFAAYFFADDKTNKWEKVTEIGKSGIYGCAIPEGNYTHVIFTRRNPQYSDFGWNEYEGDIIKVHRVFNQSQNMALAKRKELAVMHLQEVYDMCAWSHTTDKFAEPNMIYLFPNNNRNGVPKEHAGKKPTFAATFWDPSVWSFMTDDDGDGIYQCERQAASKGIILVRMKLGTTDLNWDNKWNQTADLPTTGWNLCVIPDGAWDKVQNTFNIQ